MLRALFHGKAAAHVILMMTLFQVSSSNLQVDITFSVTMADNIVCENTSISLTCNAYNATTPEYKWSPSEKTNRTIVVTATNMSTHYTCTATDGGYNMGYATISILSNGSAPIIDPVNFEKDENEFIGTSRNFTVAVLSSITPFLNDGNWSRLYAPLNDSGHVFISNFISNGRTYSSMAIQNLSLNDSGAYSYCTSNKCGKSCVSAILHVAPDNVLDSSDSSVDPSIIIWMVVLFAVILLWLLIMYCCLPRITRRCRTGGLFGQNRHHGYNAIGAISPHEQQSHYDDYKANMNIGRPRPNEQSGHRGSDANMNIGRPRPNEQSGHRGSDANMNIGRPRPNEQNGRRGPDANVNIGRPRPNEQSGHCGFDGAPRALSIGERAKQRPPLQITDFRLVYNVLRQGAISSWKPLGMQLGLTSDKLNEISADCRDNDYERHIERVFELWKQQSQKRTWKDLIRAIEVTTVNPQLCMDLSVKHLADFDDKVLDKDLSNEVLIPMAKYWFELGLALGIDETQLDNIPVADSSQGFRKMLHTWWQQNFAADRTWNTIVFSLDAVNLSVFAKEVYDSRIGAE